MRTVVFSDERVALAFNARFISVWVNQDPNTKFLDDPPKPEKYIYQPDEDLPLGTGTTNVVSIFATPEGQILDAVPGYLSAEALFCEMRLALAVRELAMDDEHHLKSDASRTYAGLHRAAAKIYGRSIPGQAHENLANRALGRIGKNPIPAYVDDRSWAYRSILSPVEYVGCEPEFCPAKLQPDLQDLMRKIEEKSEEVARLRTELVKKEK